jgi:hypothetical protein
MRKLVREPGTTRARGRLERTRDGEGERERDGENGARADDGERGHEREGARERGRGDERPLRRGRVPLRDELADLNRGAAFMGVESTAIALDVLSRVLRRAVDRAFDEDYERPGDVIRGVTRELDDAGYDLATELRGVPRRLSRRFDESLRSPRADRGERERREAREEREGPAEGGNGQGPHTGRLRREPK